MVTSDELESLKSTLYIVEFVVPEPHEEVVDYEGYATKVALYLSMFLSSDPASWSKYWDGFFLRSWGHLAGGEDVFYRVSIPEPPFDYSSEVEVASTKVAFDLQP